MKKLEDEISEMISSRIKERYSFYPIADNFRPTSQKIIERVNQVSSFNPNIKNEYLFYQLYVKWFKSTNIKGKLHEHSASGFAGWVDSNYKILPIDKKKINNPIKKLLIKFIYKFI